MRTFSEIVDTYPVVAQVYVRPGRGRTPGFAVRGSGFKPGAPTPESILNVVTTDGTKHAEYVAAGIGERVIAGVVKRPTYSTRYDTITKRPLWGLGLIPVHAKAGRQYKTGEENMPYADLALHQSGLAGESAVVVGYDLMSRADPIDQISLDPFNRTGLRWAQGVVMPGTEAIELFLRLRRDPQSVRELSRLVVEQVAPGMDPPTPDFSRWPATVTGMQFAVGADVAPGRGEIVKAH